jgi:hypothetical protein
MTRRRFAPGWSLLGALALAACSGGGSEGPGISVTVQPATAALCVGDSAPFGAQVRDGSGNLVTGAALTWSSSAPQVASVDPASGVAHALATGSTQITATSRGVRSSPSVLEVPADLVPEFVPDSLVLAPGDTMTLGVRLRRRSAGLVPNGTPVIAPFDSSVASLSAAGLVTAKVAGRAGLSLTACGQQGRGAVDVFTPPDSVTGLAYLWLSGAQQLRLRLPVRALNFTRSNTQPAFQIYSKTSSRGFVYEDTLALTGTGLFPVDSVLRDSVLTTTYPCTARRPFANYTDLVATTLLVSVQGGSTRVTSFAPQAGYKVISGRALLRMRGVLGGTPQLDTLQAIYTFSAPLTDTLNACR